MSFLMIEGQDQAVADWVGQVLGKPIVQPYSAIGICDPDGKLRGAAIFNDFQGPGGNMEMTYVGPQTLTRGVLKWLARYAFNRCNASRVTFKTMSRNHAVRKLLARHKLDYEGRLRAYYDTAKGGDALVYVLYRSKAARWLGAST